jgi:hypothetical protein
MCIFKKVLFFSFPATLSLFYYVLFALAGLDVLQGALRKLFSATFTDLFFLVEGLDKVDIKSHWIYFLKNLLMNNL